jgi:hypothetical protein
MAKWIRVAIGTDPATDYTYINLDHVKQAQIIATVSGPSGFGIELGGDGPTDLGSVYGRWDTAAHANAALALLVGGVDLSDTVGEAI